MTGTPTYPWTLVLVGGLALLLAAGPGAAVSAQPAPGASPQSGATNSDTDGLGPPVNAGTDSERQLHAPVARDEFSVVIFGDRTGGPRAGIKILDAAVAMTNHLAPTFVMTVGDLINGYNRPAGWIAQMLEYHKSMLPLEMPWYPVAGNHDVYARPQKSGGHMDLYKKHFGPLYYSFDYRWAHFIVLFSDEQLAFHNPSQNQNMSAEQMDWLREDLKNTTAKQVYVFLHHPRWNYEGCNWPDVHQILVEDGRVEAVLAGHLHSYRDDGDRDGIRYYVLAATGAHLGRLTESTSIHHINHMRIRENGWTMCVLPMSPIHGADFVLGTEVDTMHELLKEEFLRISGRATISLTDSHDENLRVKVRNPAQQALFYQVRLDLPTGWRLREEVSDSFGTLAPGQTIELILPLTTPPLTAPEVLEASVSATLTFPLRSGIKQPLTQTSSIPVRIDGMKELARPRPKKNRVLALDGKSALRVELTSALEGVHEFTLECWVRGSEPKGRVALLAKTQNSSIGIFWSDPDGEPLPTGFVHIRKQGYQQATSKPWQWEQWTHVALTYDQKHVRFWVNGKLQEETVASGRVSSNRLPFFIGADPNGRGKATSFFKGEIDEVRLSRVVRYDFEFEPEHVFPRDEDALLLLHFDGDHLGIAADASDFDNHAFTVGSPKYVEEERP